VVVDGRQLENFAKTLRVDVPPAVAMVVTLAGNYAVAVRERRAPPVLPQQPPRLLEPPAPATSCFTLQPAKFVDAQGQQRRVPRFMVVELSECQAANALRADIVCKLDDPRVQQLRRQATTQQPPEAWHCFDLDSNTPPTNDPQLMARHSSKGSGLTVFEPIDRGPPRVMTVPKGDVADKMAAGARAADSIEER
jgi:hypothetical protein